MEMMLQYILSLLILAGVILALGLLKVKLLQLSQRLSQKALRRSLGESNG